MELTNEFVIARPIDETWKILNDLEFIAPCMPGAQLTEIEGEEYRGLVKIKVGPITANYKGKASFIEQDEANKVARLKAEGRDPRQGNANAEVTARMNEVGPNQTNVSIHTDLGLSGKIASFGRGAIEDVSKKILGQFTDNLREKLETQGATTADSSGVGETPTTSETSTASTSEVSADSANADSAATVESSSASASTSGSSASVSNIDDASPAESPGVRKIEGPEAEPVDLLAVSGNSMMKRVVPALGGAAAVIALIWWAVAGR